MILVNQKEVHMKEKKWIVTAVILSGGIALGSQTVRAQSVGGRPLENPTSERQFETRGIPPPNAASEYQGGGMADVSESDVQNIKQALRREGLTPGPMNGELDKQTQQALREFQRKNDLPVTGAIDDRTAARLSVKIPTIDDSMKGAAGWPKGKSAD
jgi:Putative peptidoglycan binding domain